MQMTYQHPNCGSPCAEPELSSRSGQAVEVLRRLRDDEHDREEVGQMWAVRFVADGYEATVFTDELVTEGGAR